MDDDRGDCGCDNHYYHDQDNVSRDRKIMIKTISAGQGDRSMGAIAEHDYIEKVIILLIGGD